jgi:RNA polymerase sigma-70 factor (ECF subfamily)
VEDRPSHETKTVLRPEAWLENHGDYLFRYAMARLGNKEIAEDVVQETFLAALKGRDQFKGEASERTWLTGILKHKIMDYFRKSSRELPIGDLNLSEDPSIDPFDAKGKWKTEPASWGNNPEDTLEKKEFWKTFEFCMTSLPKRLAQAFALREFEDMTIEEICNLLKVSATNSSVILFRARARLARCLEANWFQTET